MFARQIPRSSPCVNAARAFSTSTPNRFAKINIIGNLADAPELIATSTGREVIKYAVASSHGPKDNRKTSWWRVSAFLEGPQRDRVMSLTKGSLVYIEGDAQMDKYEDKEGITRQSLSIVQRTLEIIKRRELAEE